MDRLGRDAAEQISLLKRLRTGKVGLMAGVGITQGELRFSHLREQGRRQGPSTSRGITRRFEMLSKIKNVKGGWGFLAGVLITMLLVPSVAVATGLTYTGIEGKNGTTSTLNKADVESSGQIYTTNAPPQTLFANAPEIITAGNDAPIVPTPPGYDGIVTSVSVDFTALDAGRAEVSIYISPATNCSGTTAAVRYVDTSQITDSEITFPTGVPVPNGDTLCAIMDVGVQAVVSADGYAVPAGTVSGPMQ
jgi:hypothetical protein